MELLQCCSILNTSELPQGKMNSQIHCNFSNLTFFIRLYAESIEL